MEAIAYRRLLAGLTLTLATCVAGVALAQGHPFRAVMVTDIGPSITRGNDRYDLQPSVMYDTSDSDPARRFKMWWLGRYNPRDADLGPRDLHVGDRIYYAESRDGTKWSAPRVVLKGRGGSAGFDAADDHLVGSPSVLKIRGTYYMYYEAYSQATLVTRFFNPARSDTWSYHGFPQNSAAWNAGYRWERALGIAPSFKKDGTHPVYAGEVVYPDGKVNRFLSARPIRALGSGTWRDIHGGVPVFWLYSTPAAGRKPLYVAWDGRGRNSFVTDKPSFEGFAPDGAHGVRPPNPLLGYAIASTTSPDMRHVNQNRICLATSKDGVHWKRFDGAAPGRAILAPRKAFTNLGFGHGCGGAETYDLHRAYGAGFPVALVRDGHLELMFTDDTMIPLARCDRPPVASRIRIPLEKIGDPQAYVRATRQELNAGIPCDAKWSPLHQRYFGLSFRAVGDCKSSGFRQWPLLVWSDFDVSPTHRPLFPGRNALAKEVPTRGFIGGCGGLLGDEYGRTVEFPNAASPYAAMHVFYEAYRSGACPTPFGADIHHALIFGYPNDAKRARVDLGLFLVPETQESGRSMTIRSVLGTAGMPYLVVAQSIDGRAVTLPLVTGVFDRSGRSKLKIPLGAVRKSDVGLQVLSLDRAWKLLQSDTRTVYLR